jgi:hypothetical protein
LWAGNGQSSIEDDPNCTPGSVSKPLLTETIDPESILTSLQRNSQWSNSLSDSLSSLASNSNNSSSLLGNPLTGNSNIRNRVGGSSNSNSVNSWSSNNQNNSINYSTQMSLPNTSGQSSIGEQLWGVRNSNRGSAAIAAGNSNSGTSLNRNSASFSTNPVLNQQQQQQQQQQQHQLQQQQQQQFYRSNSWNVANQQSQLGNNQDSRTLSNLTNNFQQIAYNGHFILIKNVTQQIDQSTLRALCAQHAVGNLTYYRHIPQMNCVIVRYNTKEEASNAQNKLNSMPLNGTTIITQPLTENELK